MDALAAGQGDRAALAAAIVAFMGEVGKRFSPSAFGDRFEKEVREGCKVTCRGNGLAFGTSQPGPGNRRRRIERS